MSPVSHQTIKLGRGKHGDPEDGACVMELASMLAGEQFTDRPYSACPVIGAFLRAYNDAIDDGRRQGLYEYASCVVGSRGSEAVQHARVEHLTEWSARMRSSQRLARLAKPRRLLDGHVRHTPPFDALATHALRAIPKHTDQTHAAALALIDELLAIGSIDATSPHHAEPELNAHSLHAIP